MKKWYRVPLVWEVYGHVDVTAESEEEAIDYATGPDCPFPEGEAVSDSCRVDECVPIEVFGDADEYIGCAPKAKIEELILQELRKAYLDEDNGYFTGEIYADYRDEIDAVTAGKIIDSEYPMQMFCDELRYWYEDANWEYLRDLMREIENGVESNEDIFPDGLSPEQEEYIDDYIREHVYYAFPAEHYLNQELKVDIMLDTGDMNYDFVLNSVYPCWYGNDMHKIDDKAGILWLAKQQGYTKTQLWDALKEGDMADPHGFLESMRVELANLPSNMSTVTFLVRMTLRELIQINEMLRKRERKAGKLYDPKHYPDCGYVVLDKKTMCGLYDPWSGGGSVLDIELEKDVKLPIKYIWKAIPDGAKGHGYSINSVYGLVGSAWGDTVRQIHFPEKMKSVN